MSSEGVRRYARRSTEASFALEGRALPAGYVRSARLEAYIQQLRQGLPEGLRDGTERCYSARSTSATG